MNAPAGGWGAPELSGEARRAADHSGARRLLRRLVEVVAEPVSPQERLDRIVAIIAANLVADVCSIYILRAGDILELFASHGLAPEAVHRTRLVVGEGLVGTIAAQGEVINTSDAQAHPDFVYRPETREEIYHSFLGVPIVRSGRVLGVLVVQNRTRRSYDEDEVEALQIIASVLAEMLGSGGIVDPSRYGDVGVKPLESLRLEGVRLVDGIGIGRAWLHEPRVEVIKIVADDPAAELARLEAATEALRRNLDATLERTEPGFGEHREILEAYRMFADDSGWQRRIREALETGLTAEAAVRRVQEETRLRLGHASDPYLRERLTDLEELANRLLLHLAGRDPAREAAALPPDSIIVARNMTAAELIEYDREKVRGVILEEGSTTAHVTIVARAFGLPMIGRVEGAMAQIESGDLIALDGDHGQAFIRPGEDVLESFRRVSQGRAARSQALEAVRGEPAVTRDGIIVSLNINAAFLIDIGEIANTGADGCGLFRTELAFMARRSWPGWQSQASYYARVLDRAGNAPVVFRTLDVGSDKQLPYWRLSHEDNPAMGWRGLRMSLDRPRILREQLRALLFAARGRSLHVMFPMVSEVDEFVRARHLLDLELTRAAAAGWEPPSRLEVGAMFEVPALYWQLETLLGMVDFLSVGSNDLVQFLFASDRGNSALVERYDVLSPAALRFLRDLVEKCRAAGVRLSICGEMASRPLEAMALIGIGVRHLSLAPSEIVPVKAMLRSLDVGRTADFLLRLLLRPERSLRRYLRAYAQDHGVVLPESAYRPISRASRAGSQA